MSDLPTLRKTLAENPAARAKFLADTLRLLESHGVNVNDPKVIEKLGLNLDLTKGTDFGKVASSIAITITA
jgi:hypothetical protein